MSRRKHATPMKEPTPSTQNKIHLASEEVEKNSVTRCRIKTIAGGKAYFELLQYGFAIPSGTLHTGDVVTVRHYGAIGTPGFHYEVLS